MHYVQAEMTAQQVDETVGGRFIILGDIALNFDYIPPRTPGQPKGH